MKKSVIKNTVFAAVFAALIFVAIWVIAIPNGVGGVIHFGDALIYVGAAVLPFPYGLFAASIGAGLFDLLRYPVWTPFTIVIKPLMVLCFANRNEKILSGAGARNYIAPFTAGALNVGLYFLANVYLFDGVAGGVRALPGLAIQSGGSVVCFFVMAFSLDKFKFKQELNRI
ncbi:MAG: TIGR04002 family protein [Oscillospiraceae bacterium]|nr:TIGR04002 family protein [Oscillospiraceae bacterium]